MGGASPGASSSDFMRWLYTGQGTQRLGADKTMGNLQRRGQALAEELQVNLAVASSTTPALSGNSRERRPRDQIRRTGMQRHLIDAGNPCSMSLKRS